MDRNGGKELGRGCSLSVLKRATSIASRYEKLMTVEMRVDLMKRETGQMEEEKKTGRGKEGVRYLGEKGEAKNAQA